MDRLLEWFVDIMFRLHCIFTPDYIAEQIEWVQLCDRLGLDPFNPFPDEDVL